MTIARPRTTGPRQRPPSPRRGRLGVQGGRAAFLATGPTAWYDAWDLLATTQQTLVNRVGTGSATLGSTGTSDTNDPVVMTYSGTPHVRFPGVGLANSVAVASGTLAGAPSVVEWITETTSPGTPAASFGVVQALAASTARFYEDRNSTGVVVTTTIDGGTTAQSVTISEYGDLRTTRWVHVQVDIPGQRARCRFSADTTTSVTAVSWSAWSSYVSFVGGAVKPITTSGLTPAWYDVANYPRTIRGWYLFDGVIYMRVDPATDTPGQTGWTDGLGRTVTVNRSTSGLTTAVVTRPLLMADGTDDYVQLPAGDTPTFTQTVGEYTALLVLQGPLIGAADFLFSSGSASDRGAELLAVGGSLISRSGSNVGGSSGFSSGLDSPGTYAVGIVIDAPAGTHKPYRYGSGFGTAGATQTTSHTAPRVMCRAGSVADAPGGSVLAVVLYNRALTQTQMDTASAYLLGTYA